MVPPLTFALPPPAEMPPAIQVLIRICTLEMSPPARVVFEWRPAVDQEMCDRFHSDIATRIISGPAPFNIYIARQTGQIIGPGDNIDSRIILED